MNIEILKSRGFESEFLFAASRSGGPGGQNVNKVNSKVELRFNVGNSELLSDEEKNKIINKLTSKINANGELLIVCQTNRSQIKNKQMVIERFYQLLVSALMPEKPRKATKPTLASRLKRAESKRLNAQKKNARRLPDDF